MISLLLAMDRNHVIGVDNDLPWRLPKDLRFFKEKTVNQTVIMGRKTYDSLGRSLPNRTNVVLTRGDNDFPDDVQVIDSLDHIKQWSETHPDQEYFIIGGGKIFEQAMMIADRMYITWINHSFDGDTYFPTFSEKEWRLTSKVKGERNDTNPYEYYFLQYDRI
ncbi:MAG: dihydrofolate reductase [Bacillota bacterium]|uniref:dihydrofolate reductase n=1 Tax=Virgibacillus TaxID=84406 RepID=UPI000EF53F64|nr:MULTISPECIES: dihydrofolate reductase [Virgibacillus]MCC2250886.1 dihydrofolate reductase [Virgibacillus sp. AGTR]QRZ17072.1 dihydrofolate reductase [Virgibacillus sp. AGTR]WBX79310.1 dihydrofolate reductase [Virgibacillus salarius]